MPTEHDDDLREYIRAGLAQRSGDGSRIDTLIRVIDQLNTQVQLSSQKTEAKFDLVANQIAGMNSRIGALEKDADDTGNYNLAELKAKAKERETDLEARLRETKEEKQFTLKLIIGAIGAISLMLLGGAGTVIWYLLTKGN
jgi:hypothetical protein